MAGRPRTISDTAILDATEGAIALHGLAALTLAHVSADCGLAPATLIQRFQTKRGLLLALAERAPGLVRSQFEVSRARHPESPLAALFDALSGIVPAVETPVQLANVLAFSHLELRDDAFHAAAMERSQVILTEVADLLRAATATGELLRHDPTRLAHAVYTTYTGSLLTWCVNGTGALPAWMQRDLDTLLIPYRPFGS